MFEVGVVALILCAVIAEEVEKRRKR